MQHFESSMIPKNINNIKIQGNSFAQHPHKRSKKKEMREKRDRKARSCRNILKTHDFFNKNSNQTSNTAACAKMSHRW